MGRLYISMYHYVRDLGHSRYPAIKGMDVSLFEQQIDFFKSNFTVVRMEDVIAVVQGKCTLPDPSVLLTFDDGYIDHYTYAFPILENAGVQGSFFIPGKTFATHQLLDVNKIHYILASTNINVLLEDLFRLLDYYRGKEFEYPSNEDLWETCIRAKRFDTRETIFVKQILQTALPEKLRHQISSDLFKKYVGITEEQLAYELYMTREQIQTMKRHGMFIGLHGYDHYWLANLEPQKMQEDIDRGLDIMDEFLDRSCWVMNYPYGSYNDAVMNYARSKGACVGLTIEPLAVDLDRCNPLALPRLDCNDFPPKSENYTRW